MVQDLTSVYIQTGMLGTFFIVGMALLVWYFTKGRKGMQDERDRMIKEQARTTAVIDNNSAVIQNCTEVIKSSTAARAEETRRMGEVCDRLTRHGSQLDEIQKQQAICLDRQQRK